MHAGEAVADGLDQQRRDHGGVHAAGQRQQHLAVAHLAADALDLVVDEVLGVPGLAAAALVKDEGGEHSGARSVVLGPCGQLLAGLCVVIHRQHGHVQRVDRLGRVDGNAVHDAVLAAVEDDAADVGNRAQLRCRQVVGMDFTVHAQRADLTRNFRVFFAAEVENENDVLLHVLSPPADVKLK